MDNLIGFVFRMYYEYAHDNHFDLIVMGAYGHSRIREAILGSTTQTGMRMAQMPVLLAK